jgi:hypothetical protein
VHLGFNRKQLLRLTSALVDDWRGSEVFEFAFGIVGAGGTGGLREALERAVYWFSDAQRDPVFVMQFIKLWSCVETFFPGDDITESVSRGLACTIVFGHFQLYGDSEYLDVKRRAKKAYQLRCKAVHGGRHTHVSTREVADLSRWVAYLILNVLSFLQHGYVTIGQVGKAVESLDLVHGKRRS